MAGHGPSNVKSPGMADDQGITNDPTTITRDRQEESTHGSQTGQHGKTVVGVSEATYTPDISAESVHMPLHELSIEMGVALSPTSHPESVGRMLHYEIQGLIGHGGMGVVVRALDGKLGRNVAIKVMNRKLIASHRGRDRFFREARAAASINHPNVVTIHAVDEHNGVPFLEMECVSGGALDDFIRREKSLPLRDVIDIARQIAAGLQAAHDRDVIHRDVKPANILLEEGLQRVKLTDFGLARLVVEKSDLTSMGHAVGTPSYMAPEQVEAEKVTPRSDLFSLGCVIYAMVDGHSPFRANTPVAAAAKIRKHHPDSLKSKHPHVLASLDQLVTELLQKNPNRRPASASIVANRLQGIRRELDAIESGTAIDYRVPYWNRRRVTLAAATVIGCLCMLAATIAVQKSPPKIENNAGAVANSSGPPKIRSNATRNFQAELLAQLAAAQTGDVIEIPPGRHETDLSLATDLATEITLRGVGDVTLVASGPPVMTLTNVPGIVVENVRFETIGTENAINIQGQAAGVVFRGCQFHVPDQSVGGSALIHLTRNATGSPERPIRFENCDFDTNRVAVVIGEGKETINSVRHVEFDQCRFINHGVGRGIGFVSHGMVQNISLTDCFFRGGNVAISLQHPEPMTASDVRIQSCVFSGTPVPVHLNRTVAKQEVRIDKCIAIDGHQFRHVGAVNQFGDWFGTNYATASADQGSTEVFMPDQAASWPWLPATPDVLKSIKEDQDLITWVKST
ncbi:MAG: serine/threonine-protein kinase [Planctomycetota bacterium]